MNTNHLLLLSLLAVLSLSACLKEEAEPTPAATMVQPGTTIRPLGMLRFGDTAGLGSAGENTRTETTLCDFAQDAGSVAILEFIGERQIIESPDCEGPYSRTYFVYRMRTLGVAAGQALPAEFDLVVRPAWIPGSRFLPEPGELWLTTARQAEGEWFMATYSPVSIDSAGDITAQAGGQYPLAEGFPAHFEDLADALQPMIAELNTSCPTQASHRLSDTDWSYIHLDPASTNCHPDDPSDSQSPEGETDEGGPSDGNNVTSP